ncbi:MAG: MATE family efflux transporter [Enterocloster clostridioformis]
MFSSFTILRTAALRAGLREEDALAAVGASYPITVIFMAFAVGSNLGASVVVSGSLGQRT